MSEEVITNTEAMPPKLSTLLAELKADIFATFNCVQIGKIESVNSAEQTVETTIQIKRLAKDETSITYPILVDCPYMVLQGGGAYIDLPIAAGDYCIILFNDRDIDNWWDAGIVADPNSRRKHSMSDGLVIVGINPKTSPLEMDGQCARLIGPSGPGGEKEAARKDDAIQSAIADDYTFWTWIAAAGAYLSSKGVTAPIPSSLTGKITGGSADWKIT